MIPDSAVAFLQRLIETPSPSGFEEANAAHYREYLTPFADTITTDRHGNTIAVINPDAPVRVMLSGHIDEIGFIINHITDEGFIHFRPIGGHDTVIVIGQRVNVHTKTGMIPGVIGKKPVHLLSSEERDKSKVEIHELWIDCGVTGGKDEIAAAGVSLGDYVTYAVGYQPLLGRNVAGRAFDNRIGAWVVAEALRRVKDMNPRVGVFAVATVQEEIGLRGARTAAYGIDPHIGIAVDVSFATDHPTIDKRKVSELKLGKGPGILFGANANRKLSDYFVKTATAAEIPYQISIAAGGTGTDANAIQINRAGVTTGLLDVPLRYMHTPGEIINLDDASNCAELMARACAGFTLEDNFIP